MNYEFIKYDIDESFVATVTFNREEIHNAFNDKMIFEITDIFKKINNDKRIRLVVLTGTGRSFCAGADLNWMGSMVDYTMEENLTDSKKLSKMFKAINECEKPVIGKINGHALGGGMGILAVCDYVITHNKAKFGFTETRLGLIPAVISPFCIAKMGESQARAWFLSGEKFTGNQAMSMGLIHEVVDLNLFDARAKAIVASHLQAAPEASFSAKKLIKDILYLDRKNIEDYTCKAISSKRVSAEGQEGMKALLSKRKPNWIKND